MIKLLFSGDFAPIVPANAIASDYFSGIADRLTQCDLHITNLECPVTETDTPISKTGPALKARPETIALLKQANVGLACLANNHIFDYGEKGIIDTVNNCTSNNIDTIGIVNLSGNSGYTVKTIKGTRIAFVNYCEHEFSVRGKKQIGANGYDHINAYYTISKLKTQTDYIVVIYHGGNEYYPLPSPKLQQTFRYLADLGADAVIGHHTHVISGYELYRKKPLVYSLGNFFFPLANEPQSWHEGITCTLQIDGSTTSLTFEPVIQCKNGFRTETAPESIKKEIAARIHELSATITKSEMLEHEWNKLVSDREKGFKKLLISKPLRALIKLGLPINKALSPKKILEFRNLLTCQSHYNLFVDSLKKQK